MRVSSRDKEFFLGKGDIFVSLQNGKGTNLLTISKELARIAGVNNSAFVDYDDETKTLYIHPLATPEVGSMPVKNRQMGMSSFFRYAGISPDKGRYRAFYDPEAGDIVVKLA